MRHLCTRTIAYDVEYRVRELIEMCERKFRASHSEWKETENEGTQNHGNVLTIIQCAIVHQASFDVVVRIISMGHV